MPTEKSLLHEAGGHRIQRIPPTERKGRVHTSTVTVAVMLAAANVNTFELAAADLKVSWFSGTGAGGQHRNKHQNSCRLTYIPTNTTITAQCRKRTQSYNMALQQLTVQINKIHFAAQHAITSSTRKLQTGSGMRADKIRTYQFQRNKVKDHRTNKVASTKQIMNGRLDLLW